MKMKTSQSTKRSLLACALLCICAAFGTSASAQTEEWVARYNGPANSDDVARDVEVDASGNVYVTGYSYGVGSALDYATVKYDSAGNEQWVARYNGPANNNDYAFALAVDASGNVYVTGKSVGSGTNDDYATVKYDSAGNEQWVARYNGPANSSDEAYALGVDGSGNVNVTGSSVGSGTGYDYATVKYDSAGNEQWVARYNGPANSWDGGLALAVDASGNVYV
ncbi:MAG: SBBP repeat-containing protein, partial [Armatimonadetes bacterium]|nr:SBBP repeat-containing protein [Armatimonadota bacterium]